MRQLLEKQAAWQKSRARLSWPEKIRQAAAIRESVSKWRATAVREEVRTRDLPACKSVRSQPVDHDLDDLAGTWVQDGEAERALAEMDRVDAELTK